jgi:probable phosphoglycerate mutase
METAEIVSAGLRLPPPLGHDGLKERCFGAVQGVPKTELGVSNPMLLERILKRNPAAHFEAGETMDEFADRVLAAIREIGARHEGRRILAITHGWVLDVVTRHIHGLPRSAILNMKRKNGEAVWVEATASEILPPRAGHD